MTLPLMPKATAVWLVENTTLSFDQIAQFCGMHPLEVQGIADGEVAVGIVGKDPIVSNQLTKAEIERCEKNHSSSLKLQEVTEKYITNNKKKKQGRYTPVARRQDKPDAIAWLLKHCPGITDAQVTKLIGTTKKTIASIKDKSHWNFSNIKPRDPVLLGLCLQRDLDSVMAHVKTLQEKSQDQKAI